VINSITCFDTMLDCVCMVILGRFLFPLFADRAAYLMRFIILINLRCRSFDRQNVVMLK